MKAPLLLIVCLILTACKAYAQTRYDLSVMKNGEEISWQLEGLDVIDKTFRTEADRVVVAFEGGRLELNLADFGNFDYAHVLGVDFTQTAAASYLVSATVRHNDQGWDNYADSFEVKGERVENGLRVLTHPHDNEQPFTRSQSNVRASGLVHVAAKDNVEGWGGSVIYLDLEAVSLSEGEGLELRYQLLVDKE